MTARWMELRSFSNLGLRGTSKIGKTRALSSSEMSMKVVVGLEVSFGCLPGDINESKVADQSVVETSSADMFPFVGAVPEHDGQWIAAGFAGHGKLDSTIELPRKIDLLTSFSHRHAPNSPLNSQHHILHSWFNRVQPLCSSSCRSLSSSAKAFPGHQGEGREVARDGYCQEGEAY
jgi:hypothetical protein